MRCIDADTLFREMEKAQWYNNADRDEIAEELVLNAPTIEPCCETCEAFNKTRSLIPQPQRTGRWIPVDSYSAYGGDEEAWMAHGNPTAFYYCSECKEQNYMGEDGEPLLTAYCPDCGARMEGE